MSSFSTQNFHLAAALVCSGYPIERVQPAGPRSSNCVFEDSTELRDTVEQYWSGKLEVSAIRHYQEQKTISERSINA